ncbi:protein-disulfide reductase DsbD domain-containing protein [Moraxella atlantae]|uniref:cytochrome c biogenesis protein CcdA n=1 Tax=Faucicola atlantae TaxID=34059 RepID=UPI0037522B3A
MVTNNIRWALKLLLVSGWLGLAMPTQAISLSDAFGDSGANVGTINPANEISGVRVEGAKPLPVTQAFNVTISQQDARLTMQAQVQDGYYVYRDKFKLTLPNGVTATPLTFGAKPSFVDDPDFGRVAVFDHDVSATTSLKLAKNSANLANDKTVTLKWQGCAKAGLCYPPQTVTLTLADVPQLSQPKTETAEQPTKSASERVAAVNPATNTTNPNASTKSAILPTQAASVPALSASTTAANIADRAASATADSSQNEYLAASASVTASASNADVPILASSSTVGAIISTTPSPTTTQTTLPIDRQANDPFGLNQHAALALLLLFLAGLGLAFTPCVLPMLPIVTNIVAQTASRSDGNKTSRRRGLVLTGSYAIGVASSYGVLGALVAVFGQSLGLVNRLQQPPVLLAFAALFVVLALYMLDKLPLRLPAPIAARVHRLGQVGQARLGSVGGSLLAGFFSALVVSPCVSAPLAGALAGVAATGNAWLGFGALFMLGLGLSTPLVLLGATQGTLMQRLPKAGAWMNWVKSGFAWLLLAVALLLIERVWQSSLMLLLWACWWAVLALAMWQMPHQLPKSSAQLASNYLSHQLLWRAPAVLMLAWVGCLVAGLASGSHNSLQPLDKLTAQAASQPTSMTSATTPAPITITDVNALPALLAQHPRVLVDITADWCLECRLMERDLFAAPPAEFANWQRVRLDVTADTPASRAVYQTLDIFAPPVLLYYQEGKLQLKQQGAVSRSQFEQTLAQLVH